MCDGKTKQTDILSLDRGELAGYIIDLGESAYRGRQIYEWLHGRLAVSFDEMTNISKALRERLRGDAFITDVPTHALQESKIDGTRKYAFRMSDGQIIESVLMKYKFGYSICISSQAGCQMGCTFCASTIDGCARNLSAGEMTGQVYAILRDIRANGDTDAKVSHVVVMGSGEPLLNYDALITFIKNISDEWGQNLSKRSVTVSTCGIVPGIQRLMKEELPITLALSLHAPTQEKRETIMPIAKKYPLDEVMECCLDYFRRTGRRVTYEYALIDGVNDSREDACDLARLLRTAKGHVNLIPLNFVAERGFGAPRDDVIQMFFDVLSDNGINVTKRRSMGRDIDGACGQLRRKVVGSL